MKINLEALRVKEAFSLGDFKVVENTFTIGDLRIANVNVTKLVGDIYEGEYKITPKIEMQTLPTAQKSMQKDMIIEAIPYAEVSNAFNGQTVTIG